MTCVVAKQNESDAKTDTTKEPDDLEMIGGTSEDDFSEAIALVRYILTNLSKLNIVQRERVDIWNPVFTSTIWPLVDRNLFETGNI